VLGLGDSEFSDNTLENELAAFLKSQNYIEFPSSNNPRVSIIIITYNKAHYAYHCLRSLLIDGLPPCELIIVDNGSSDETPELLRRIKNVKLILNTKNQYFSHAITRAPQLQTETTYFSLIKMHSFRRVARHRC